MSGGPGAPPLLVAQFSDLHLRAPGLTANRIVETNMLAARAFAAFAALAPAPDALVITGDLADRGEAEAYRLLAGLIERHVRVPVILIPGNHDDRAAMRATLGDRLAADDEAGINRPAEHLPVRLLPLDSTIGGESHGRLGDGQLRFLRDRLAADPRPAAILLHHPPIATGIAHMDAIGLENAAALEAAIAPHAARVAGLWCGHVHRMIHGRLAGAPVVIAPSVAHQVRFDLTPDGPSALVLEPPAFVMHRWDGASFTSQMVFVDSYPGPFPFLS